jgi:hypothetical protein
MAWCVMQVMALSAGAVETETYTSGLLQQCCHHMCVTGAVSAIAACQCFFDRPFRIAAMSAMSA